MFTMQMRLLSPVRARRIFPEPSRKLMPAKKVITVKGTGNEPEMTFIYDDKTQLTTEKTVEGLAGKSPGHAEGNLSRRGREPIATRIAVSEAKK